MCWNCPASTSVTMNESVRHFSCLSSIPSVSSIPESPKSPKQTKVQRRTPSDEELSSPTSSSSSSSTRQVLFLLNSTWRHCSCQDVWFKELMSEKYSLMVESESKHHVSTNSPRVSISERAPSVSD